MRYSGNKHSKKKSKTKCFEWTAYILLILGVLGLGYALMNLLWNDSKTKTGSDTYEYTVIGGSLFFLFVSIALFIYIFMKGGLASILLCSICCFCCLPIPDTEEAYDEGEEGSMEESDEEYV
jgi:hypothetical protein